MSVSLARLLKPLALCITLIAIFAAGQKAARADEVTIAGFTNGCFGPCTPPNSSSQQTATILGLTWNNSTFNGTTSLGFLAFGNAGQPPGTQNINNLGSLSLNGSPANYHGQPFTLRASFTLPTGIAGSNTTNYSATLVGSVTAIGQGGVFIDFNNTPQTFTFSFVNGQGQTINGAFSLNVLCRFCVWHLVETSLGNAQSVQATPRPTAYSVSRLGIEDPLAAQVLIACAMLNLNPGVSAILVTVVLASRHEPESLGYIEASETEARET